MKVTIIGGWDNDPKKNEAWNLDINDRKKAELQEFCRTLGRSLARRRHEVFVGSDDEDRSVDPYVVQGMGEELAKQRDPPPLIRTIEGIEPGKEIFTDRRYRGFESFLAPLPPVTRVESWPRAAAKIVSVREADVVFAIAGLRDTYIAGIAALVARRRVVPVAVLGGASRDLFYACKAFGDHSLPTDWNHTTDWDRLYSSKLDEKLAETALRLGGLDRTSVFLGYCGRAKATASRVKAYLEAELNLRVLDWATDFKAGHVILSEIQTAARVCKYGVFLFTPDDRSITEHGEPQMVPRDNVVFEAGFFMNAHGPQRTAIIVQRGTKILADYDGYIHLPLDDPEDISPIERRLREVFGDDLQPSSRPPPRAADHSPRGGGGSRADRS
jgi:hypothetical protein